MAETSYASCGDLSLAYQVFGDGPVELVIAGSFVSHVELSWTRRASLTPQTYQRCALTIVSIFRQNAVRLGNGGPSPDLP
jgi:hypothetical protein